MKRENLISAILFIAVLFSASVAFSQTDAEYKTKIQKLEQEMTKAMLAGDMEANMKLYTADAISMPSYEPMKEGIAAIRKSNEEMMKSGMKITAFEPTTLKVMSSGNLVTEIGTYIITMTIPGMEKPMDDHGKYLTIWEKQKDGSLKIKIETWNTDVNPMAAMSGMDKPNK